MREYSGLFEYRPSIVGSMSVIGATAVGATIDTQTFKDVLAILSAGSVKGSGSGSTINLNVKIQESASPVGTGALWTDITDEAVSGGSFALSTLTITGTNPQLYMDKKYGRLQDDKRKRYIRAHATLTGTIGLYPKFSVGFLLGRPSDTLYITNATTQGTGNIHFTKV